MASKRSTRRSLLGKAPTLLSTEGRTTLTTSRHPDRLVSKNGNYRFQIESDGNIALYETHEKSYTILWESKTHRTDKESYKLVLEEDGNLAAYQGSTKYWESKSNKTWSSWFKGHGPRYGPYQLLLNDFGEVRLENRYGLSLWEIPLMKTEARQKADAEEYAKRLEQIREAEQMAQRGFRQSKRTRRSKRYSFEELTSNGFNRLDSGNQNRMISLDQVYALRIQLDGNIVFSQNMKTLWQSNTHRSLMNRYSLILQPDGNLVAYENETTPYWATDTYSMIRGGTERNGPFRLFFDGGRLHLGSQSRVIWSAP